MRQEQPTIEVVDDRLADILRRKTPAEKIAMIAASHRTARMLAAAGIRYHHPDWPESKIQSEAVKRVSGGTG